MNFHNFSICPMILKFCGDCPGTLEWLGFLNYARISLVGL
jgi:hypothetical protein